MSAKREAPLACEDAVLEAIKGVLADSGEARPKGTARKVLNRLEPIIRAELKDAARASAEATRAELEQTMPCTVCGVPCVWVASGTHGSFRHIRPTVRRHRAVPRVPQ